MFKLHDTFGFPKELTRELAEDSGLEIDEERFDDADGASSASARRRSAKKGRAEEELADRRGAKSGRTEFVGYETLESDGRLRRAPRAERTNAGREEGEEVRFVLDRTPFYAESGGPGRRSGDRPRSRPERSA